MTTPIFFPNEKRLIDIGIVRLCDNCDFKTMSRTEMRKHERYFNHTKKEIKKK